MNRQKQCADYVQCLLADYCMPTLFGLKPSSLISLNKNIWNCNMLIQEIDTQIEHFGCQCIILYENRDMANLFVYNEELLNKLISCIPVKQYLISCGYRFYSGKLTNIIDEFKVKLKQFHNSGYNNETACFPHEIGALLGYPLEDVEDFIRFHGKNYILCDYWKVYHNAGEALKTFDSYRKIRLSVIDKLKKGINMKDITNI